MNQKDAEPGEDIEIVETNMHIRKSCFPIPRSEKEEEERQKKITASSNVFHYRCA